MSTKSPRLTLIKTDKTVQGDKTADFNSATWANISNALRKGHRGLPGGSSLAALLAQPATS